MKMKPVDVKSNTQIQNLKLVAMLEYRNIRMILQNVTFSKLVRRSSCD